MLRRCARVLFFCCPTFENWKGQRERERETVKIVFSEPQPESTFAAGNEKRCQIRQRSSLFSLSFSIDGLSLASRRSCTARSSYSVPFLFSYDSRITSLFASPLPLLLPLTSCFSSSTEVGRCILFSLVPTVVAKRERKGRWGRRGRGCNSYA